MKKVLHFITGIEEGGGAENMLLKTLPYLKSTENRACVLKGRGGIGSKLEEAGISVYYLDVKNYLDFDVVKRYKKVILDFKPDIQINYLIHADIFGRFFAKKFGVSKLVSFIRNRHIKALFVFLDKITLKKTDYLLTNSKTVLDFYRERYNYSKELSKCIPNGVKIDNFLPEFNREELKRELEIKEEDFVITSIASLHKQKDHQTLFKAIKVTRDKGIKNLKFLLCGEGREKNNLIDLRKKLKLEKEIKFLGVRLDKYEILSISNLFILPSLHEGMSNGLLEAMNLSLCSIVSDISENKELIKDQKNGLTFKTGDFYDLADKIMYIVNDSKKREELGIRARETIVRNYDISKIIEDLDKFLKDF